MEVSGQIHAPAALTRRIGPSAPIGWLDGCQNRSGRCGEEKNLAPAENQTPAVKHVAHRYTDVRGVRVLTDGSEP
jgi:predicted transglutaminase-like cysteine proteinase